MSARPQPAGNPNASPKQLTLRYPDVCERCHKNLPVGSQALYDFTRHEARCVNCAAVDDPGKPGASSEREYERRRAGRQVRVKAQLGEIMGGVVLAATQEPQWTRAFLQGALGEQKLAEALVAIPEIKVLHDRRVPGTRGNIDHIVVGPAGVFVVDAKHYSGLIQTRVVGFFKPDLRLYVGRRNGSRLGERSGCQPQ